ncbi:hypothetical protein NY65_03470 [Xanthomonas phaseoli pv. phaseoli]|nr:hypothetical protein NY68_11875 [Xanthomonas citri pv. fuscans]KGP28642.1 hypothetical protein NY67_06680 [Xanthomonas citri pv. fuscans]KGP32698.1 hypothetical protein NY65_03470 [Xanthomonas phaseoli pv. phaseoli]KGP34853.1 hypothetical protein NY64_13145 [Xanthomonas citri pv. fuscans]
MRVEAGASDAAPSHATAQWRIAASDLAHRCGGSSGIAVRQGDTRTGFPFKPPANRQPPQGRAW